MTPLEAAWRGQVEVMLMSFAMKATLTGALARVPERDLPRLLARIMVSHAASFSVLADQSGADWLADCIAERRNSEEARDRVGREEIDAASAAKSALEKAAASVAAAKMNPEKSADSESSKSGPENGPTRT